MAKSRSSVCRRGFLRSAAAGAAALVAKPSIAGAQQQAEAGRNAARTAAGDTSRGKGRHDRFHKNAEDAPILNDILNGQK